MGDGEPLRFGAFEVDLHRRELRKHGVRLKLQPQPFEVLAALLESPGELVTREQLRLRIWGSDTFIEFDQGLNRAVSKLREVLGDSADNPRFIETMARRGYRFMTPVVTHTAEALSARALSTRLRPIVPQMRFVAAAGVVSLCIVLFWSVGRSGGGPPLRVVPLTTLTGEETHATFSPDGKAVAFVWSGEARENFDLYVQAEGSPAALRLTSHPAPDGFPSWSPGGKTIAFSSYRPGGGIFVISPFGGAERKLTSIVSDSRPSWSNDGRFLVVASAYRETDANPGAGALFVVPVEESGEPREILRPSAGVWHAEPALSPDQRSLAFASCSGSLSRPSCSIQVVMLKDGLYPMGTPRQIADRSVVPQGLAWTRDGTAVIYGAGGSGPGFLWRVSAKGNRPPERLEIAGPGASFPAIDLKTGRVAFTRSLNNSDIWRVRADGSAAVPFLTSTARECCAQYSPDGQRIAFESGRGGASIGIWLANADGSGISPVTRAISEQCGSPRWSPDGQSIAFDCFDPEVGWNIWTTEANGGLPRQLTSGGGDNIAPSWSHDGRSVYYSAKRAGRFQIWRVPAAGGAAQQVTRNGGYIALESADGETLFYTLSEFGAEGLFAKKLTDGEEKQLIAERVGRRGFAVFPDGIYYLGASGRRFQIRLYEFATRRTRVFAEMDGPLQLGLGVSPDRNTFLFSKVVFSGSDLMVIKNFR